MDLLLKKINAMPEMQELRERITCGGAPVELTGVQSAQKALTGAALFASLKRPEVFLCADEREAQTLCGDLRTLTGREPVLLLGREWQFRAAVTSREWEHRRLAALCSLAEGEAAIVVATVDALCARTLPPQLLRSLRISLKPGDRTDPTALTKRLTEMGYSGCQQVEGVGQFALRGGILDVFSPLMEQPLRCEFFDDEIDSMGAFDPGTQRRVKNLSEAWLLPVSEVLPALASDGISGLTARMEQLAARLARKEKTAAAAHTLQTDSQRLRDGVLPDGIDRYLAAIYPDFVSAVDYLPENAVVFLCESARVDEQLKTVLMQLRQDTQTLTEAGAMVRDYARLSLSESELYAALERFPVVMEDALPTSRCPMRPRTLLAMTAKQLPSYGGSLDAAAEDIEHFRTAGFGVLVLCGSKARAENLLHLLEERGIPTTRDLCASALPEAGQVRISLGALSAGCELTQLKLTILTEGQLLAPVRKRQRLKKDPHHQKLQSYTDLAPGDLVVHVHHGIGRFVGIQRMPVDGVEKDYIKIDYAGGDCLYVPVTQLDLVSKYIGGGEDRQEHMRLNKLGGTEWARQKSKAKAAVKDLAKGLIRLYAERSRQPGFAFSPDSAWQQEFEDAFEYEETADQLRAIREIKQDMESPRPMDRLLCGDVGYGKTEVALRAVMKCILDGKQAAILVPTTVLARQHYATAVNRFRSFPVKIALLSRYTSAKETKAIWEGLKAGSVDLVIGTHKLLQKNIQFRSLGLLVVDEEQRFGVTHKERLRELAKQVDTLTLSATPIPRTLNMALTGLRDLSTIEEPPRDRHPVQTYVLEHDWNILIDAIRRELDRGGQVFYLHNRVESIAAVAARLGQMLGPEVRIVVGHGKMGEQELYTVMQQMVDGEADVMVCTTIIETGIDIPNVNTLIIEDADRYGLAQLHQIRGRIGRSSRRAYAYLTFRPGKVLQETASKRLTAIREYVEFGSGFRIAMRDLEIRGAGNLLGAEQSGFLMSVGYDLYLKLLEEAVLEEKGEQKKIVPECSADLTLNAHIPERYVASAEQRMDLYRRIAAIRTDEAASELLDELIDRYGEPPKPVMRLLDVALLRAAAVKAGVCDISQKGDRLKLTLASIQPQALAAVCAMPRYKNTLTLSGTERPVLTLRLAPDADVLDAALTLIEDLKLQALPAQ